MTVGTLTLSAEHNHVIQVPQLRNIDRLELSDVSWVRAGILCDQNVTGNNLFIVAAVHFVEPLVLFLTNEFLFCDYGLHVEAVGPSLHKNFTIFEQSLLVAYSNQDAGVNNHDSGFFPECDHLAHHHVEDDLVEKWFILD